jgi:hypothetical protein
VFVVVNNWLKLDSLADLPNVTTVIKLIDRVGANDLVRDGYAVLPSIRSPEEQPERQSCVTPTRP